MLYSVTAKVVACSDTCACIVCIHTLARVNGGVSTVWQEGHTDMQYPSVPTAHSCMVQLLLASPTQNHPQPQNSNMGMVGGHNNTQLIMEYDLSTKECKSYMGFVCTYKSAPAKMQESLRVACKAVHQFQDKVEKPSW